MSIESNQLPLVLPDDDGIRPAGRPDECFYCQQKVGQPHTADCVTLYRRITVRYRLDLEIEVPHSWGKADVEFHRNESSWCASNAVDDLLAYDKKLAAQGECLCRHFEATVIEIPEAAPYRRNKDGEVVP